MNQKDYPIQPASFTKVRMTDSFWAPKIETNRTVTIPSILKRCEETGRIDNFAKAAKLKPGNYAGVWPFDDTDVYKLLEAAGFSLGLRPDPELEKTLDAVIGLIAAAQEPDGYLFTWRTIDPDGVREWGGPSRWSNIARSHEHYNAGHLFEAAVAYYQSTGKRALLDVALKYADLLDHDFGPGKLRLVDGHPEVELGLVKLFRLTGEERFLRLAQFFIDERGRHDHRPDYGEYHVDAKPVLEMDEARGHVVRAAYLFSGMADVGALTGNSAYIAAIDRLWENVVFKKLYITGGMGAIGESGKAVGETFGDNYQLPNLTAYNETCASIANAFWNHRMFLLHGEAKYLDVLERVAYNGIISGVSLNGDEFLYPNPLESDGQWAFNVGSPTRSQWFDCACCTANIARFLPAFPGYMYAAKGDALYVNLFAGSEAEVEVAGRTVRLRQETRYPWEGRVAVSLGLSGPREFTLLVRIPGWALDRPVPSDLYRYLDPAAGAPSLAVNGAPVAIDLVAGFARIRRIWKDGDTVELVLPMSVRRVVAHGAVKEDAGKVALTRGPIVYCLEGADNGGRVLDLVLPDAAEITSRFEPGLLRGVVALSGTGLGESGPKRFLAIPYFAWANRGAGEMAVWMKRR